MINRISLFAVSAQSFLWQLFPHRRQPLVELLEETMGDAPVDPGCMDVLELWLEEMGVGGLMLGDLVLFLVGGLLMVGVDLLLRRWGAVWQSCALNLCSAAYHLVKFRVTRLLGYTNCLLVVFLTYWLLMGFHWSVAFITLVLYTNVAAWAVQGGRKLW